MNEEQQDDNEVWTSCKDCVFAIYKGKTQTGCSTGRLQKFKDVGACVVEAQDGKKEYMVIDRFCNQYREKEWRTISKPHRLWKSVKNKEKRVKKEIQLRCGVIIVLSKESSIQDMEKTVLACLKQKEVKPDYIVVVNNSEVPHDEVISKMHGAVKSEAVFYATKISYGATLEECIDFGFAQAKNGYYIVFEGGYEPPPNFLDKINRLINEELEAILLLKPKNKIDGLFVQCMIHKMLGGNVKKSLVDKLDEISEEENTQHLIRKWEDILDD